MLGGMKKVIDDSCPTARAMSPLQAVNRWQIGLGEECTKKKVLVRLCKGYYYVIPSTRTPCLYALSQCAWDFAGVTFDFAFLGRSSARRTRSEANVWPSLLRGHKTGDCSATTTCPIKKRTVLSSARQARHHFCEHWRGEMWL